MNTFKTTAAVPLMSPKIVVKVWFTSGIVSLKYFNPDQRHQLRRYIHDCKDYEEIAVREITDTKNKVKAELDKGYYSRKNYYKHFPDDIPRIAEYKAESAIRKSVAKTGN